MAQSFGNRSLDTIDDVFVEAGGFLKQLRDDPDKLKCLNTFAESHAIIDWILKETKSKTIMVYFLWLY